MIFSIGHSNHSMAHFLDLLRQHQIQEVGDVRSVPFSRHAPHFGRRRLEQSLVEAGITYLYLGHELGGRPVEEEFYDQDGHVLYGRLAATPGFQAGMDHLLEAAGEQTIVVMCAEEDPVRCHRTQLIGRVLKERGIELRHIRGNGSLEEGATAGQLSLLSPDDAAWRSLRPVPRPRQS